MSGRRGGTDPRAATPVAQDYLKAIWNAEEWSDDPVTASHLADRMNVAAPTVSQTLRRLVDAGWVDHTPYGSPRLTDEGRRIALAMVRRHRLIETWLVRELGYRWDEVHDEAESLEHAVSDRFVERIDVLLGHPRRDPHGDPIPAADGTVVRPAAVRLTDLSPGEGGTVARVDDADPEVLRECAAAGIGLDSDVVVPTGLSAAAVEAVWVVVRSGGTDTGR